MTKWKIVPCEPTPEMYEAGKWPTIPMDLGDGSYPLHVPGLSASPSNSYRAMLAASPAFVLTEEHVEKANRVFIDACGFGEIGREKQRAAMRAALAAFIAEMT
jgi:hypothetical protein